MVIIIAGSRGIEDYSALLKAIESSAFSISEVVCGGARGVDSLGKRFAEERGLRCSVFRANWGRFGKAAGMYRNSEMAEYAEGALILWDGDSRGTLDMIDKMRRLGKPVEVYNEMGDLY